MTLKWCRELKKDIIVIYLRKDLNRARAGSIVYKLQVGQYLMNRVSRDHNVVKECSNTSAQPCIGTTKLFGAIRSLEAIHRWKLVPLFTCHESTASGTQSALRTIRLMAASVRLSLLIVSTSPASVPSTLDCRGLSIADNCYIAFFQF
jgi:hypothetical protein